MAHVVHGRMDIDVGIRSPADKFYDVYSARPHHVSNVIPEKIQGCKMHEGEWGKVGSVIYWNYVHAGEAQVAKEIIEAIDEENMSVTFRVIEGDVIKLYKNFIITVSATPKDDGTSGSVVHWTFHYEKQTEETPEPFDLLEFLVSVTKDVDAHLVSVA